METAVDSHQALKDLAIKFDESSDPIIFVKIMLRVDNLLKYSIARAKRIHPHLGKIEFDDLYQTAVVGLYQALAKVTPSQRGDKLIYNIIRYIDYILLKDYKYGLTFSHSIVDYDEFFFEQKGILVDNTKVYADLEAEFIQERFQKLIKAGVISVYEFDLLNRHFVQGLSCREIARQDGKGNSTISRKVRDSLNRLRIEFIKRNWEEG